MFGVLYATETDDRVQEIAVHAPISKNKPRLSFIQGEILKLLPVNQFYFIYIIIIIF